MEKQACLKEFIKYCFLNVSGMIGLSCYILADTFFISKGLGANGLTALNLAIPVYSLIHGSGLMLGMGGATKYSIYKGQKKQDAMNRVFTNTVYLALLFSAVFVSGGILFSKNITSILGADGTVFAMTHTYLKVILWFAPAFILNDILICFVRNDGAPKASMLAMLEGSFSNIILDYIFIFPLDMGIFGAVIATGIAPVISMVILSGQWIKKKSKIRLVRSRIDSDIVRDTLALGMPSFVTELSSGIVIIIFNTIILGLQGNVGVAAYGVIANISLVVVAVFTGIAQGMQPLISTAYGEGNKERIKNILLYAMLTMVLVSGIIYLTIFFGAEAITEIFNSEGNLKLQEIAASGIKIYFCTCACMGCNVVLPEFFTSIEKPIPAHIISLTRGLILIIPLTFLLSVIWGIKGVWMAFPITELSVTFMGAAMCMLEKLAKN